MDKTEDMSDGKRPTHLTEDQGVYFCEGSKKSGNQGMVWCWAYCGLVLSACSQWEHFQRSGKGSKNTWGCAYCKGRWSGSKNGARLVQLYGNGLVVQIILDLPPQHLWNKWCKERIEYYKRYEPLDAPRDAAPNVFNNKFIFEVAGELSDHIWTTLLADHNMEERKNLHKLAESFCEAQSKAVEKEKQGGFFNPKNVTKIVDL